MKSLGLFIAIGKSRQIFEKSIIETPDSKSLEQSY